MTSGQKPKGEINFSMLPKDFFIVYFSKEEDVLHMLEGGPWFMGKLILFLKIWYEGFHLRIEIITTIPI